jgi:LDH2 family malate/lactate/ureidoglycolate dehydrogenase
MLLCVDGVFVINTKYMINKRKHDKKQSYMCRVIKIRKKEMDKEILLYGNKNRKSQLPAEGNQC